MKFLLFVMFTFSLAFSQDTRIVIGCFQEEMNAKNEKINFDYMIRQDREFQSYLNRFGIKTTYKKIDKLYVLSLEPFSNTKTRLTVYNQIKDRYPDAYKMDITLETQSPANESKPKAKPVKKVLAKPVIEQSSSLKDDDFLNEEPSAEEVADKPTVKPTTEQEDDSLLEDEPSTEEIADKPAAEPSIEQEDDSLLGDEPSMQEIEVTQSTAIEPTPTQINTTKQNQEEKLEKAPATQENKYVLPTTETQDAQSSNSIIDYLVEIIIFILLLIIIIVYFMKKTSQLTTQNKNFKTQAQDDNMIISEGHNLEFEKEEEFFEDDSIDEKEDTDGEILVKESESAIDLSNIKLNPKETSAKMQNLEKKESL